MASLLNPIKRVNKIIPINLLRLFYYHIRTIKNKDNKNKVRLKTLLFLTALLLPD